MGSIVAARTGRFSAFTMSIVLKHCVLTDALVISLLYSTIYLVIKKGEI